MVLVDLETLVVLVELLEVVVECWELVVDCTTDEVEEVLAVLI